MTLSRRDFIRRSGMAGGGALALALIGCGEDDSRQPAPSQDAAAEVSQQVQPAVGEQQVQGQPQSQAQPQPEPQIQQTAADPVEQQSEQTTSPPSPPSQPQAAQPEPPAERRVLVRMLSPRGMNLKSDFIPIYGADRFVSSRAPDIASSSLSSGTANWSSGRTDFAGSTTRVPASVDA